MKVMTKIVPVLGFLEFLRQLLGISAIRILKITYPTYPLLKDPKGPAALPSISEGLREIDLAWEPFCGQICSGFFSFS
jgi:hypothetical protein